MAWEIWINCPADGGHTISIPTGFGLHPDSFPSVEWLTVSWVQHLGNNDGSHLKRPSRYGSTQVGTPATPKLAPTHPVKQLHAGPAPFELVRELLSVTLTNRHCEMCDCEST